MDGSASEIMLDENSVCNFCHIAQRELKMAEQERPNLDKKIKQIKYEGRNNRYDCLLGLSGGVDSSTALHYAVKLGLRPLCFTMDNGYNDPVADENVLRLVETLKVPLYRYVLDLDKFRDLQAAYLKAGVINVEAAYDNLLAGASYEMAAKYGIKWIVSGGNVATESVMPESWSYRSGDMSNMKDIYRKMKGKRLKSKKGSFPLFGTLAFNYYKWVKGIKVFYLLDYL